MYLIRLDDASEYWDREKWFRISALLNKYKIKPIFGIIPENKDPSLLSYPKDDTFWNVVQQWIANGYTPALHSYEHIYHTECAGINPVNSKSEFAGLSLEKQLLKIRRGNAILLEHGINAEIFFALAHTFDQNTLEAIKRETDIRIVSDTIATDIYYRDGLYFIPQQAGMVRKMPFKTVTFCYHPNTMSEKEFLELEAFLEKHSQEFTSYSKLTLKNRRFGVQDQLARWMYFGVRKLKKSR